MRCVIALVVSVTTVPWYCELWQYSLSLVNGQDRHARGPLSLVPSLFLDSSVNPDEYINDMLKTSNTLNPGSEVRRWKGLWMNIKVSGNSKQKSEFLKFFLKLWVCM